MATEAQNQSSLDRYVATCLEVGLSREQTEELLEYGIVLQPTQLLAHKYARECDDPSGPESIGYGGARGGGKSHWLLAEIALDCLRFPGLKCLLLRKILKKGKEAFEDLRRRAILGVPHRYVASEGVVHFSNGSQIYLGHYKDEKDIDAYLGLEYDVIGIEESTTLTAKKIENIGTCNRSAKGFRPRIYETTNPGGVSHARFKKVYIRPWKLEQETDTRFIPATYRDNAFLDAGYHKKLDNLAGWQRAAWRDGDWDIDAGLFFSNFKEKRNVLPAFEIPSDWTVWAALDYGFTHKTAFGLFAESNDGDIYLIDTYSARKRLPPQHAQAFDQMLAKWGIQKGRLRKIVAGSDCFANKADKDGETIAMQYSTLGWTLVPANDDRVNGAAAILRGLGDDAQDDIPAVETKLYIFDVPGNRPFIDQLGYLMHDEHRPEDVEKVNCDPDTGEGGDDEYDMTRYGVMAATENSWVHNKGVMEFLMARTGKGKKAA